MATSYVKDEQGGTFIAASQRPDGTWRKQRRVKDGYVPQEEVPLYESLGKQFQKNKPTYPVGMSPEFVAAHKAKVDAEKSRSTIPGMVVVNEGKKKKKKSNKNKSANVNSVTEDLTKTSISDSDTKKSAPNEQQQSEQKKNTKSQQPHQQNSSRIDTKSILSDNMKRLKSLRKKMREIEVLENKIKSGEIKNPEKEMMDKIARKKEIIDDVKLLESNQ